MASPIIWVLETYSGRIGLLSIAFLYQDAE